MCTFNCQKLFLPIIKNPTWKMLMLQSQMLKGEQNSYNLSFSHLCWQDKLFHSNFLWQLLGLLRLEEVIKMENSQHFLLPPRITKYMTTSYLTCTLPKSYTGNRIGFGFFPPGEPFPLVNILLHLCLTNARCVVVVQLSNSTVGTCFWKNKSLFYPPTISLLNT